MLAAAAGPMQASSAVVAMVAKRSICGHPGRQVAVGRSQAGEGSREVADRTRGIDLQSGFVYLVPQQRQCLQIMPSLSSKPYRIGRSKAGLGLFATQPIKKGSKIIRYFGPMLDCNKKKDDAVENKYLFQITKRWTVDGSVRKNIARYINHAC